VTARPHYGVRNHCAGIGVRKNVLACAVIAVVLLVGPGQHAPIAHADPPSDTQRELGIERTLACPQCTDLPLDVCDQDICNDMRGIIHQKVTAGESDVAIRQYFVQRYGTRVLLAPPMDWRGIIAWALPFIALLLGGVLTAIYLRSARRRTLPSLVLSQAQDELKERPTAGYRSRVEREVKEME